MPNVHIDPVRKDALIATIVDGLPIDDPEAARETAKFISSAFEKHGVVVTPASATTDFAKGRKHRDAEVAALLARLKALGFHVVASVDVADVMLEWEHGRSASFDRLNEIARAAASDLAENELGHLPIGDAIAHAAVDK
jgi:hypothetical protein